MFTERELYKDYYNNNRSNNNNINDNNINENNKYSLKIIKAFTNDGSNPDLKSPGCVTFPKRYVLLRYINNYPVTILSYPSLADFKGGINIPFKFDFTNMERSPETLQTSNPNDYFLILERND